MKWRLSPISRGHVAQQRTFGAMYLRAARLAATDERILLDDRPAFAALWLRSARAAYAQAARFVHVDRVVDRSARERIERARRAGLDPYAGLG